MKPNISFLPVVLVSGGMLAMLGMLVFCLSLLAGAHSLNETAIIEPAPMDRLVHPGSPLDTVMQSQRNDIGYLQTYPVDLTGLPGWRVFNASGFDKDGIKPHKISEKVLWVQNRSESITAPIKAFLANDGMPFADPSLQEL